MNKLVNLCGKAIKLEDVTGFAMDRKNYVFIPCFREVSQLVTSKSFFGKETSTVVKRYEFYHHIPYAVVLGEKESAWPGEAYAYKTAGEIAGLETLKRAFKVVGDTAHLAARALKIDTSINRKYRLLVDGRDYKECRFDELPARLICQDGRKVDVYKDSELYFQLGKNITPYEEPVPVLEVQVGKNKKLMFFGNGIDVDNVEEPYQALLTAYNLLHDEKANKKKITAPKISIPKIDLGSIKIQSPILIKKKEENNAEKVALEEITVEEEKQTDV